MSQTHPRPPGTVRRTLTITNQRGLHARAAAKFVRCVESFEADVEVTRLDMTVSGHSIMGLMMLAASPGCTIDIAARGVDAQAVLQALSELVERKFHEE